MYYCASNSILLVTQRARATILTGFLPMKKLLLLICVLILAGCNVKVNDTNNSVHPRFELYKTQNMFTSLLLDSRTGRLWQVQYSLDKKNFEGAISLSSEMHADENGSNGRFVLSSTPNIWTFLLTDTVTGAIWHCQFSLQEKQFHGCFPLASPIAS